MLQRKPCSWGEAGCSLGLGELPASNLTGLSLLNQHFTSMHRNLPIGELATQWKRVKL